MPFTQQVLVRNMGCEDFSKAMGVKEEMNAEAEITDIQRFRFMMGRESAH